jgi:hypothetical protein
MARRERLFGIAEKVPKMQKRIVDPLARRKVVALESRRPKRR